MVLTGNDELAAYDRKVEIWISSKHNIPKFLLDDLESVRNSGSAKDVPYNGTEGVKGIYWEGTEAGLMGVHSQRRGRLILQQSGTRSGMHRP
jgi:hypothetical protein